LTVIAFRINRFHFNGFKNLFFVENNFCIKFKKLTKGKECCSNSAIGFHKVTGTEQYKMEYFLYYLRHEETCFMPKQFALSDFWIF